MVSSDQLLDDLRNHLEEQGIDSAVVDEFIARYEESAVNGSLEAARASNGDEHIVMLEQRAAAETDWRTKAALRAEIISHKIGNDLYNT